MSVPYLACMAAVAAFYGLPPRVLPAIQAAEGGRPGLIHPNANGSADLGVMQVNTIWLDKLSRIAGMQPQTVQARLLADPCFNIAASGLILRNYLDEAGGDLMTAVGWYHSHTPHFAAAYRLRVMQSARVLFHGEARSPVPSRR